MKNNQRRCFQCEACKYYMKERAAHLAAISEANDKEAAEASWNAFKHDHQKEFECTNPQTFDYERPARA